MFRVAALVFAVLASTALGSNVQFTNRCGYNVDVVKTENGQASANICSLGSGQSCKQSYGSNGMNFKNGMGGKTLAEFSFNSWNNMDFYDLSVVVGYDTPVQISSDKGCPTVTCKGPACPDAYLYPTDDTKTHGCPLEEPSKWSSARDDTVRYRHVTRPLSLQVEM
jgi:hypothetical protein